MPTAHGANARACSARPTSTRRWTAPASSSRATRSRRWSSSRSTSPAESWSAVFYHGMGPLDALQTFAILSIGNALVTTLPAFLISTSMGLMVTRVAGDGALGVDLAAQLIARPDALRTAGVLMAVLAFRSGVAGAGLRGAGAGCVRRRGRVERSPRTCRGGRARGRRAAAQGCDSPARVGVRARRRRRALDRRRHRTLPAARTA